LCDDELGEVGRAPELDAKKPKAVMFLEKKKNE